MPRGGARENAHGGARPGAGRKPRYGPTDEQRIIKVRLSLESQQILERAREQLGGESDPGTVVLVLKAWDKANP